MSRGAVVVFLAGGGLACAHAPAPHPSRSPVPPPAGERAAPAATAAAEAPSLYKRLGGYDAIAAVTDEFLARMLADPPLARFFAGHGVEAKRRIRQLIVDQLCQETGGPCVYIGRDMQSTHTGMGITDADWQAAVRHLVGTLDAFRVPRREKDELLGAVSALKEEVVENAERLKAVP